MKTYRPQLMSALLGLLSLVTLSTPAAETADLTVSGVIRPPACNVTLANDGVVDFGIIKSQSLDDSQANKLPRHEFDMSVSCNAPIRIAIYAKDNRHNQTQTDAQNALGGNVQRTSGVTTEKGAAVGAVAMTPLKGTGDGATSSTLQTTNDGKAWKTWPSGGQIVTWPGNDDYFGWGKAGKSSPAAFTNMTETIGVDLALAPRSKLPDHVSQHEFDASVTFKVVYL
ncbi:DUF1120 domain-containing protein [Cupriavidus agavae]|uniref:Uncharacterized protein DUF1120 n=1 Tax=Cupriavidus agavae TaxID=1001822 RepID=A0A4Q7S577_9BURK|nr:DUF1120 domain-containing protein [Cupriavidus agavae]RZT41556.1 uncharacterized protein DUF1120 [Cupriavidus agavae]